MLLFAERMARRLFTFACFFPAMRMELGLLPDSCPSSPLGSPSQHRTISFRLFPAFGLLLPAAAGEAEAPVPSWCVSLTAGSKAGAGGPGRGAGAAAAAAARRRAGWRCCCCCASCSLLLGQAGSKRPGAGATRRP